MQIHCKYDELVNPSKLKNHPKNRNKHGQDQIERLAEIYKYHGIRHPIIVSNLSKCIVAGHGRKLAAIRAGIKEMPVVFQEFESTEKEYAFIQADNAIALWAELDMAGINEDIGDLGPDFDINMLGIQDFTIDVADKFEDKDADEIPEEVEPIAKLGQIYKLGEHRLMCGDSTDEATVAQLMNGEKADMVFTDPPYGAGFEIENDKPSEFQEVFNRSIENASKFCDSTFIIACYYSCISEFVIKMKELGFTFNEKIVWVKNLFGQGKVFHRKHEDFLFFSKGNHLKDQRNKFDDVMNFDSVRNFMGSKNAHEAVGHPTQKPTELLVEIMKPLTKNGFKILDPFGGSGSTLIACEKTNRKCFMMELDPHYVDVIIARWEKFTGKKAELLNG